MPSVNIENARIAVIGLGYVGLPLAIEFAKKYRVSGFDIDPERIGQLKKRIDKTLEANIDDLNDVLDQIEIDYQITKGLELFDNIEELADSNIFIITVPTPIDRFKSPDLNQLLTASEMVGKILKQNDLVIYESTVYPGCTEEDCVPILEKISGLKFNIDFFCGYSPERINPGDKTNTLTKIIKVTSGSTPEISERVDLLYRSIIVAGTHKAPSIKVAEASKAIENAQRDINISFMNELALIFDLMGIDTTDVLEAAATKWNFLNYKPGLVGGHCIGVDPYYLVHKAKSLGYHPDVILSGRRVNDNMGIFIANKVIKLMINKGLVVKGAKILVLGFTFKENCPDTRNTKVVDIINEFGQFCISVDVYDPLADRNKVKELHNIELIPNLVSVYDAVVLTVGHDVFKSIDFNSLKRNEESVIFDTKSFIDREFVNGRI